MDMSGEAIYIIPPILSKNAPAVLHSSLSKLVRFFFPLHLYTNNPSNSFKSESACGGDSSKVDHNVVIGLLREILALLGTLLFELKGGDYKGCDVNVLSGLLAGLLIVRFSVDSFLAYS